MILLSKIITEFEHRYADKYDQSIWIFDISLVTLQKGEQRGQKLALRVEISPLSTFCSPCGLYPFKSNKNQNSYCCVLTT